MRVDTALLTAFVLVFASHVTALIVVGGKEPVEDHNWPDGSVKVANASSRVGWWEGPPFGGGEWQFLYRGDTNALNEVLKLFSQVAGDEKLVVIHDGPTENEFLKGQDGKADTRVDWTFTVWTAMRQTPPNENPKSCRVVDRKAFRCPVTPPRVDIYIGDGNIEWDKVKIPEGLVVADERSKAE